MKEGSGRAPTIAERMQLAADKVAEEELFGGTSTVRQQEETLSLAKFAEMMRQAEKMRLLMQRSQITFIVDASHQGEMMQHTGPAGYTVECSPIQAREVHRHIPLRIVEVESEWRATFTPAVGPYDWAPSVFSMPPWTDSSSRPAPTP